MTNIINQNLAYLLALHSIDGLGPIRLKKLLNTFSDPKLAWEAEAKTLQELGIPKPTVERLIETRKTLDPEKYLEGIKKSGIKIITIFDPDYPEALQQIYDPPTVIYYKGEILEKDKKAIGVVGTRKITGYGKLVTEKFTKALVDAGFTIVSGLARGVDSCAHWTAVKNNGRTIAVLGGGLNKIYPPENILLVNQIIAGQGAVITEFPPDYPSVPGNFPARNRIISGLSKAVLVTEAAVDSGSLITARVALEQGRDIFAIPGPITSDLSRGPADLIKEGARLVFEPSEILDELGVSGVQSEELRVKSLGNLDQTEQKILEYLANENKHVDEICRNLNLSASVTNATLLKMEILGLIRNLGGGVYCKI